MDSTERLIDLAIQTRLFSLSSRGWGIADEPFFVADLGQVIRQHRRWRVNLPDVHPFFGGCPLPSKVLTSLSS
jgi:ornithine decarboxylase